MQFLRNSIEMAHVPRSGGTCRSGNPAAHAQQFAPGRCNGISMYLQTAHGDDKY